uniref:Uncharacterized protein n=1 Tax=Arion vulgaris TaxID=1028688 RepID=A0A0B7AA03_9EUPU
MVVFLDVAILYYSTASQPANKVLLSLSCKCGHCVKCVVKIVSSHAAAAV